MKRLHLLTLIAAAVLMSNCYVPKIRGFYQPNSSGGVLVEPTDVGHLIHADTWNQEQGRHRLTVRLRPLGSDKLRLHATISLPRTALETINPKAFIIQTQDGTTFKPIRHQSRTWYLPPETPDHTSPVPPEGDWIIHSLKLTYHTGEANIKEVRLSLNPDAFQIADNPPMFEPVSFKKRTGFDVFYTPGNR